MAIAETNADLPSTGMGALGSVVGHVATTLKLEAAVELVLAVLAFRTLGGSWWLFAVLFLVPDVSMFAYFINNRVGAAAYNFAHSYLTPAALALMGFLLHQHGLYFIATIWFAHIGLDRMLGYGLKYSQSFGATHLGRKGKKSGA